MRIQLTDYGVSLITQTKKAPEITRYTLGTAFGYLPSKTAQGISGTTVKSGQIGGAVVVNANVVKYQLYLDYPLGPFDFGEIAYFDKYSKCVAVAVSSRLINKIPTSNKDNGNSINVDAYLSMVDENYTMWADSIGDNNKYSAPTAQSVDVLPPVSQNDPNLVIVGAPSPNLSATLAYASSDGLWNFDTYSFSNARVYTILSSTATSITVAVNESDYNISIDEVKADFTPKYYGDKVIEFSSGELYSICRTVRTATFTPSNTVVLAFTTPLAELPVKGDSFIIFSRSVASVSSLIIPPATESTLGGIIVGEGLSVTPEGVLTPIFPDPPVTSVNGYVGDVELKIGDIKDAAAVASTGDYNSLINRPEQYVLPVATSTTLGGVIPYVQHFVIGKDGKLSLRNNYCITVNGVAADANGNIEVTTSTAADVVGLVNPRAILDDAGNALNSYTDAGLFYGITCLNIANTPVQTSNPFTLEVVPISGQVGACVQRFYSGNVQYIRTCFGSWSQWSALITNTDLPVASYTQTGIVSIVENQGLSILGTGELSANVWSVQGKTGDVVLTSEDLAGIFDGNEIMGMLKNVLNVAYGIPQLNQDAQLFYGQTAPGTLLIYGEWDPTTNIVEEDANMSLKEGGVAVIDVNGPGSTVGVDPKYEESDYEGLAFVVTKDAAKDLSTNPTGLTLRQGDVIVSVGDGWKKLFGIDVPATKNGDMMYYNGTEWTVLPVGSPGQILTINASGNLVWSNTIVSGGLSIQ